MFLYYIVKLVEARAPVLSPRAGTLTIASETQYALDVKMDVGTYFSFAFTSVTSPSSLNTLLYLAGAPLAL